MNDSFSEFYMTFMKNMMMYECMDNITYEAIQKNHKSIFFVPAGKVNEDFMDRAYHHPTPTLISSSLSGFPTSSSEYAYGFWRI